MEPVQRMCMNIGDRLLNEGWIESIDDAVGPVDRVEHDMAGKVRVEVQPVASSEEFGVDGPPISMEAEHTVSVEFTVAAERWLTPLYARVAAVRSLLLSDRSFWRPQGRLPVRAETARSPIRASGERPLAGVMLILTWREVTDYSVDDPDLTGITATTGVAPDFNRFVFEFDLEED